jgi:hypothetical protein
MTCRLTEEIDCLRVVAKRKAVLMIRDVVEGGKGSAPDASKIDAAASEIVTNFGQCMEIRLKEVLAEAKSNLREIDQKLSEDGTWRDVNVSPDAVGNDGGASTYKDGGDGVSSVLKDTFKKMPNVNLEGVTEQGVKLALEQGKKWLPKLFKGIGPKTMGKWATTASRWAGPVVAVGTTIYEVYQVVKQEREMKRQIERQTIAIADAAEKFVKDLSDAYSEQVRDVIADVFTPISNYLDEQKKVFESNDAAVQKDRQQFDAARITLLGI